MKKNHWNKHAHQWSWVKPPLKPCAQDIVRFEQIVNTIYREKNINPEFFKVILLGVTPEITQLRWPLPTQLIAVDRMPDMIQHVWQSNQNIESHVVHADWQALPFAQHSADLVIGDGCFTFFKFPEHYQLLLEQLKNTLNQNGYLLLRLFVNTNEPESSEQVFEDLRLGKIGNFHIFKWRLAMSLQKNVETGVKVSEVWQAWNHYSESAEQLALRLSWPIEEINTINAYQHSDSIYYYPSAEQIRTLLKKDFSECGFFIDDYELAERCPIFVFKTLP